MNDDALQLATMVLREELLKRDRVYYGYLSCIESAISEYGVNERASNLARFILDRIIGEGD